MAQIAHNRADGGWLAISFQPPVPLKADQKYVIRQIVGGKGEILAVDEFPELWEDLKGVVVGTFGWPKACGC